MIHYLAPHSNIDFSLAPITHMTLTGCQEDDYNNFILPNIKTLKSIHFITSVRDGGYRITHMTLSEKQYDSLRKRGISITGTFHIGNKKCPIEDENSFIDALAKIKYGSTNITKDLPKKK